MHIEQGGGKLIKRFQIASYFTLILTINKVGEWSQCSTSLSVYDSALKTPVARPQCGKMEKRNQLSSTIIQSKAVNRTASPLHKTSSVIPTSWTSIGKEYPTREGLQIAWMLKNKLHIESEHRQGHWRRQCRIYDSNSASLTRKTSDKCGREKKGGIRKIIYTPLSKRNIMKRMSPQQYTSINGRQDSLSIKVGRVTK